MSNAVIFDAVTLQNMAVAGLLPVLESVHPSAELPRWTEVVRGECEDGRPRQHCVDVCNCTWLGDPAEPADLTRVMRIQQALSAPGDAPRRNLGEATSIALAIEYGGTFVTDDRAAYRYALRMSDLGTGRVQDMCWHLETAISFGDLTQAQVDQAHHDVAAANRTMRCRH